MKKMIFPLIIAIFISACKMESLNKTGVISVAGSAYKTTIFEIRKNSRVRVSVGSVYMDLDTGEVNFYGDDYVSEEFKIKTDEWEQIQSLLVDISNKPADDINPANDSTEVFAVVDEKLYYTPLSETHDYYSHNKVLSELTFKLINETQPLEKLH